VEVAAVVVVPGLNDMAAICPPEGHEGVSQPIYSSLMPILGNDVLHPWMDRVRRLGVQNLWLTSGYGNENATWIEMAKLVKQGVERFLMIRLKSYAEMDLADLLSFHCQSQNSVTEAHDSRGLLGVCVLDRQALPEEGPRSESPVFPVENQRTRYAFRGYAKRLLSATERQELVGDALTGACAMRPAGAQVCEQVWIGESARLADSARVNGPAYVGDHTVVRAGATIGPFASVERNCVVDSGTTVERSTVLPGTYLGIGLHIQNACVDGEFLQDLRCGIVADLRPGGLARRIQGPEFAAIQQEFDTTMDVSQFGRFGCEDVQTSGAWRKVGL
jgi:hypothetical protein